MKRKFIKVYIGVYCSIMMILCILLILFMLLHVKHANAGELDAWEFNIMGINPKDFEDRDWPIVVVGCVSSFVVHELGHFAASELMGVDASFSFNDKAVYAGDGYYDWSNDQKALFHGAGFLAQTLIGGALTAIPKTRHSDFTLGFNTFSSVNSFIYGITGGNDSKTSDVKNLDKYGYNGTAIALGSGIINGGLTYISLDKSDD